ncbi:MAG: DUF6456 domain-containing protein [Brevundimonas sp.]|uniref:DUF6456 domain-containing protein n=1 Tax=Brevundimonas sp. TaxID=1871086 RepID=UPI002732A968|nr:DUF6456 domain-containing protein [Brevundimonas sp.]MDP3657043.1 DUF6456 domain-containing protein [Brevundimonas sp.]
MSGAGPITGPDPLARARRLLARGGWIEGAAEGYSLRPGGDRRRRVVQTLCEADFLRLIAEPGLRRRPGGGWAARTTTARLTEPPPPGQPGLIEGERAVMEGDGRLVVRRANLGHSGVAWLAQRRGPDGQPWLGAAEAAAAARLALDAETASRGPSLTLRWDAVPGAGGGSARCIEPGEAALAAARRVRLALAACGPARSMVDAICIRASALQAAERDLGLRRREGRRLLRAGLTALAAHYRIG